MKASQQTSIEGCIAYYAAIVCSQPWAAKGDIFMTLLIISIAFIFLFFNRASVKKLKELEGRLRNNDG
jgi:hypothetical protein